MSDAVWYYAQNDQEKGPVTTAELRSLAAKGKIKPVDLVWKDGMGDWTAAAQIKGLIPETPVAPPAASSNSDSGQRTPPPADRDSAAKDKMSASPASRAARWIDGPPAEDSTPSGVPRVPMSGASSTPAGMRGAAQSSPQRRTPAAPSRWTQEVLKYVRHAGVALTVVGLLLVLAAKGCDTVFDSYTARITSLAQVEEQRFQQEWNRERMELEAQIEKLKSDSRQAQRLQQAQTDLANLNESKRQEQARLLVDRWADLRAAAATAKDDNRTWAFWRSLLFVFGALVLVPGLLAVGFAGQGAERWICLVMLAIVTFSLFVYGAAWSSPLLSS
ncbi:MAG: GYF domain-containing protein [Pirellulaceae bacterium]